MSLEEAHIKYKLEPINMRWHRRCLKAWEQFEMVDPELARRSMQENADNTRKDHAWWKRIGATVGADEPIPFYA